MCYPYVLCSRQPPITVWCICVLQTPHIFVLTEHIFPPNCGILGVQNSGAKEKWIVRASSFLFLVSL